MDVKNYIIEHRLEKSESFSAIGYSVKFMPRNFGLCLNGSSRSSLHFSWITASGSNSDSGSGFGISSFSVAELSKSGFAEGEPGAED